MRIGVLTFHRADNFGAVIQSYALTTYLHSLGYEVEIIDYRCRKIEAQYQVFSPQIFLTRKNILSSLCEYVSRFKNVKDRMTRRRKMESFRERYLPISASHYTIPCLLDYDIIITGSDQVWNFHLNKGSENVYLLDFPMQSHTQRVAYAASSEKNGMRNIEKKYLAHCLSQFDKISVRETFIKESLQKFCDKEIEVCLDPTFLLCKEQYLQIASRPVRSKYILIYHMTYAPEVLPCVSKIAEEQKIEVVEIFGSFIKHSDAYHITNWSPTEVIGYIADAEIVFTTSFHGLALSLILNKDVWVIDKGNNFRQKNLLSLAGLSNRMLSDFQDYNNIPIDYKQVSERMLLMIDSSKDFLRFA